jgi:hypothetical protein
MRRQWIALSLSVTLLAALPVLGAVEEQKIPKKGTLEGEVVRMTAQTLVMKDKEGKEIVLNLNDHTDMGPAIKPGDKVEVFITPQGVTTSVQPLKGGLRR